MVDLHLHSTFSDGSRTPEEVVALAREAGLSAAVLLNRTDRALRPRLRFRGLIAPLDLPAHSIATCTWK